MKVFNLAEELEKERKKNKELEELCNKYEEEHNTKFNEWVFDKRENERLTRTIVDYDELLLERNNRIDKAVEIIKKYGYEKQMEEDYLMNRVNLANYNCLLLDILKGDNK